MPHDVFISYSSKDQNIAFALCHKLEEKKIKCWIAPRNIRPGENFAAEIAEALPKSKIMIIVLSSSSNSSKQVLRETEIAINNDLIVIPVRIENIIPTGGMSYYLSTINWIDILDNKANLNIDRLTTRIYNVLGIVEDEEQVKIKEEAKNLKNSQKAKKTNVKKSAGKSFNIKRFIPIMASAVVVIGVGLTIFFMRDTLFSDNQPEESATNQTHEGKTATPAVTDTFVDITPIPTSSPEKVYVASDFGWDENMTVEFEDEAFKELVGLAMAKHGVDTEDGITVGDMLKLEFLIQINGDINNDESFAEFNNLQNLEFMEITKQTVKNMCVEYYDRIDSLDGLQYARNLKYLSISNHNLDNLLTISELDKMYLLYITGGNSDISDISPIGNLTEIRHLHLSGNYNVSDISPLSNLKELRHAMLRNMSITDVSALSGLEHLHDLFLEENNISDISSLASINLYHVWFSENPLNDLGYLTNSDFIKCCGIMGLNSTGLTDISFLNSAGDLQQLNLLNNDIEDIRPLAKLVNLKQLYIDAAVYNNNIEVIERLVGQGCEVYTESE